MIEKKGVIIAIKMMHEAQREDFGEKRGRPTCGRKLRKGDGTGLGGGCSIVGGEVSPGAEASLGSSHAARHVWGQQRFLFDRAWRICGPDWNLKPTLLIHLTNIH